MIHHELYDSLRCTRGASITSWAARLRWALAALGGGLLPLLAACAAAPVQTVQENLDPQTGNTAVVLPKPMEMVADASRGPQRDPFAFLAPFEVDRMGDRRSFLWVSVPQDNGPVAAIQVLCQGQPITGTPVHPSLGDLGLTKPPYRPEAPWSGEWYFPLPDDALKCLSQAAAVTLVSRLASGSEERFSAGPEQLRSLAAFPAEHAPALR